MAGCEVFLEYPLLSVLCHIMGTSPDTKVTLRVLLSDPSLLFSGDLKAATGKWQKRRIRLSPEANK